MRPISRSCSGRGADRRSRGSAAVIPYPAIGVARRRRSFPFHRDVPKRSRPGRRVPSRGNLRVGCPRRPLRPSGVVDVSGGGGSSRRLRRPHAERLRFAGEPPRIGPRSGTALELAHHRRPAGMLALEAAAGGRSTEVGRTRRRRGVASGERSGRRAAATRSGRPCASRRAMPGAARDALLGGGRAQLRSGRAKPRDARRGHRADPGPMPGEAGRDPAASGAGGIRGEDVKTDLVAEIGARSVSAAPVAARNG